MIKWIIKKFFKNKADNLGEKEAVESHKVRNLKKEIIELDRLLERKDARMLSMEEEINQYHAMKQQDKWVQIAGKVLGFDLSSEPKQVSEVKQVVSEEEIQQYIDKIPKDRLKEIKAAPEDTVLGFVSKSLGWNRETGLKAIELLNKT